MARVLVLGGYGLIGAHVVRRLLADGHAVTALGRDAAAAARVLPDVPLIPADLRHMRFPENWLPLLEDIDFVVNCAGALQDGGRDDLSVVHLDAISALVAACEDRAVGLVQVSSVGARRDASTAFLRTKAEGDAVIAASQIRWWIFRPGLVVAPSGYGGTALIRMLAAVPLVQPIAMARARVQSISVSDVAEAVARAIDGKIAPATTADLVEDAAQSLKQVVAAFRHWLGFAPARLTLPLPGFAARGVGKLADLLGRLGWRSPLRSTAIRVLAGGVEGEPAQTRAALGRPARPLAETLRAMPARAEDRLFARMQLLMPLAVATLALFWLASGLIGLLQLRPAASVLQTVGWSTGAAIAAVLLGALADITLGLAVMTRRWAKRACWGMVAVSLAYLAAGSWTTPGIWLDPLGPFVKVIPGIILALITRAALETR